MFRSSPPPAEEFTTGGVLDHHRRLRGLGWHRVIVPDAAREYLRNATRRDAKVFAAAEAKFEKDLAGLTLDEREARAKPAIDVTQGAVDGLARDIGEDEATARLELAAHLGERAAEVREVIEQLHTRNHVERAVAEPK